MTPENDVPRIATPPGDTGPKRSLVLSGGGMRLSYQGGAIRALMEAGLNFYHIDATSGGSINLSMLFSGLTPVQMCDRWRTLNIWDTVSFMSLKDYLKVGHLEAAGDADGMIDKVYPHLGIDLERVRRVKGIVGTYNVLNYTRKAPDIISHEHIDMDMFVAGMSLPGVFPPVTRDGTDYLDCAFVQDANMMEAVRRGAEEIWLVWGLGNTADYKGGAFNIYMQMLEMSANGALNIELERIKELNDRILAGEKSPYGQTQPIRLHMIRPKHPLPLDPALYMSAIDNATLVDMGYADASAYLASMSEQGVPIEPNLSRQIEPKPGITFRETMAGGFALDETDPEAGAKKGQSTELAMHATIKVYDMERFISDPDHLGSITGRIDYPAFGENIPAKRGVFNLFSPTDDSQLKLMVYELEFAHEGQDYYLAGKKEVRDDPGFDLWSDTTTLYVQLHRGIDKTGPVVGAGILKLGVAELAKLVTTMHPTSADSLTAGAAVVAKFGRFFLGELYDSYVKPKKQWWKFW